MSSGSLAALSGRFLLQLAEEVKCSVMDNVRQVTVGDYKTAFDPKTHEIDETDTDRQDSTAERHRKDSKI